MVDISPLRDGGVIKEVIKEGEGEETAGPGYRVKVHYTGTLTDGTKFDSSKDRNEPFTFELGKGRVIKAWDIGVATMRRGEVAMLTCAAGYAYGKAGSPPKIPPNATLKFEVEVLDWSGEDISPSDDLSIQRFQLVAGQEGESSPTDGALVQIHLQGRFEGRVFEERDVQFCLGEGEDHGIVGGVEYALEHFIKGEKSKLVLASAMAFKSAGKPEFGIPPNASVEYIVELKNFEKGLEGWSMDAAQKIEQSKLLKEKGTTYFKAAKYSLAIKMYQKILVYLDFDHDYKDELKVERASLMLATHLNLALCYLKSDMPCEAREACDKAIKLDENNEKAFFRRGQAYLALTAPDKAICDFERALEIDPKNTAASKQLALCNNLIKQQLSKEKKLYANMFDKFAKKDKQKEEEELRKLPDVMRGTLGEWGQEERPGGRDATAFEKENPDILMLNANGSDEFKNM